ncbi:MAG: type IV pilus assembly protein PilM [Acidimicrobiia bacterium]|nr:type IV pilus assembly protein PilM [Acidimicrobiia bacterium]MDH3469784.1 type IV pilus assembly protein PilM [Acidimicrobiia bacterium]
MPVLVGLDIGTVAVRAAAIDIGRKLVLRRFGEMPLPPGVVVAGEILDEDAVSEAVAALWKRHKLPKKRVIVGTANQRVIVRQVDVPQMEESELTEALPFQVQDSLPIPVDEAMLDYVPLEEFATPEGEAMLSILVVAAHREMIESILRVTESAGLTVEAVDLQPFALVRAAFGSDITLTETSPQGIIDIGATITQVIFVRNGVARFVRILPRGGDNFTQALVSSLDMDADEAEEIKKVVGVEPEGPPSDTMDEADVRRVLTQEADSLIEEIRGSVTFYLGQSGDDSMSRIVVAGNGARLPHLANRLGRTLDIPIEPAKVLERVDVGRVQLSEAELLDAQAVLPTSVGLALWGSV